MVEHAYTNATTIRAATAGRGEFRAGGTDVQERLRSHGGAVVDIRDLRGLDGIAFDGGAAAIGALVRVADIGSHPRLQVEYPGLTLPAQTLATPQIRAMATVGGVLCQRTRCAYYRHPDLACPKKGTADACPSRAGFHHFGVCFDFGPCVYPHPSSIGCALLAYEAGIDVEGRGRMPVEALYGDGSDPTRDHVLEPGELLTRVVLPPPDAGERASYFRLMSRAWAEWPLVEVVVRLVLDGGVVRKARLAIGGVANIPFRLVECESELEGRVASGETFRAAAARSTERAKPLPQTEYKVPMVRAAVLEGLELALANETGGRLEL